MKLNKTIFATIIAGIVMGALAAKVHAEPGRQMGLKGTFVCDAMVWPADKYPFDGEPESKQVRRYNVSVRNIDIVFTAVGGSDEVTLFSGRNPAGIYGDKNEVAWSGRFDGGKGPAFFGYRSELTGDSVGFFNCQAKRKF